MKFLFIIAAVFASCAIKTSVEPIHLKICNREFLIVNQLFSLKEAEAFCHCQGGKLADINTNTGLLNISKFVECHTPAFIGSWQDNNFKCGFGLVYNGGAISEGIKHKEFGVVCSLKC